jgi:hypothetical protein
MTPDFKLLLYGLDQIAAVTIVTATSHHRAGGRCRDPDLAPPSCRATADRQGSLPRLRAGAGLTRAALRKTCAPAGAKADPALE